MRYYKIFSDYLKDPVFKADLESILDNNIVCNSENTACLLIVLKRLRDLLKIKEICNIILEEEDKIILEEHDSLAFCLKEKWREVSFGKGFKLEIIRNELINRIKNG